MFIYKQIQHTVITHRLLINTSNIYYLFLFVYLFMLLLLLLLYDVLERGGYLLINKPRL